MSTNKKPLFSPKMATKINVPILSNVVPGLSSLTPIPEPTKAPVADTVGGASAIAISNMPAKKRPLHSSASSVNQASDAISSSALPRDIATRSTSSDSSYEEDARQSAKRVASGRNKKDSAEGSNVIIVPSSSSSSSSAAILDKYDRLSKPDLPNTASSSSSSSSGRVNGSYTTAHKSGTSRANVAGSASATAAAGKEKRTRVRKPKPTSEVLPASMPTPSSIIKMTKYFRKTPEGIVGISFTNMDGRPVVDTIDRSLYPETHNNNGSLPHHIMTGDVVISVNNLDSRFTAYDRLMSELVLKNSGGVGGGEDRASIKNSVTDSMAVVVLARPVYA